MSEFVIHNYYCMSPHIAQIQQLTVMGFSREDARRALIHTGSNVEAAIQFLTARHQH